MKIRVSEYCTCGGSMNGSIAGANADEKAAKMRRVWKQVHSGAGHAPCDQKTAAAARRKDDARD